MKLESIIHRVGNVATEIGLRPGCGSYSISDARISRTCTGWSPGYGSREQSPPGTYVNRGFEEGSEKEDPRKQDSPFFDNLEGLKDVEIRSTSVLAGFRALVDASEMNVLVNLEKGLVDENSVLLNATERFKNVAYLWACFRGLVHLLPKLEASGAKSYFAMPVTGVTAIQASALSNSVACVEYLLGRGIDCNARNDRNHYTPLHLAAFGNARDAAELLLEHGANPEDRSVNVEPVLHSAVRARAVETVALLLERGASTIPRNYAGETPLHVACFAQSIDCVDLLLGIPETDAKAVAKNGRTPLHLAVMSRKSSRRLVEVLLNRGAKVNAVDEEGFTPLHIAAINELSECVDTLIEAGADLSAKTRSGVTAFGMIHRRIPESLDVFKRRLDRCLRLRRPLMSCNREFELRLDFEPLFPSSDDCETSLINVFLKEHRKDLLLHPLVTAFLHLKWDKIRKFYLSRILVYFVTVISLTAYVLTAMTHRNCLEGPRAPNNSSRTNVCRDLYFLGSVPWQSLITAEWYLLLFLICFTVPRKMMGFVVYQSFRQYLSYGDNVLDLFVILGVFVISVAGTGRTYDWRNFVGAFVLLCAWTNLMLLVGQLPTFGTYVAMFTRVQWEFAKLLLAYSSVLIGFTVSFCIIFAGVPSFANPLIGLIKVLAMMAGDLDFEGLMHPDEQPRYPVSYAMSVCSQVLFTLFLVFVTVILMNLLVGIAVDDIQGLRRHAGLTKLVRQTKLIIFVEMALNNSIVPRCVREWMFECRLTALQQKRILILKPLNSLEKRLPKDIIAEAYRVAMRNPPLVVDVRRNNNKGDEDVDGCLEEEKETVRMIEAEIHVSSRLEKYEREVNAMREDMLRSNRSLEKMLYRLRKRRC